MHELVIANGTVVTADATRRVDIGIDDGRITAVAPTLSGRRVIDAGGLLVIPGGVDIHVHMQLALPGFTSSDSFYSGTRAAAFGGTTTIVDFVHPEARHPSLLAALAERRAEADPQVVIDYALHMALGPWDIARLHELPAVTAAGCASTKLYMAYSYCLDDAQLYQALRAIAAVGGRPVIHAENWALIGALQAEAIARGATAPPAHPRTRPAAFEGAAAARAIAIADYVDTPLHVFHVSCDATVDAIRAARRRGRPITGETCPQYLLLTSDVYDRPGVAGALPVCAPPIREQAEQDALWAALAGGDLQLVSTDHCPFMQADKGRGLADFRTIPGGVPSVEIRLAALYSVGVRRGRLSLNRWVDLCCTMPARLVGLPHKGDIAPGFDADIVLFDFEDEWLVQLKSLHENCDWTPYAGLRLTGRPHSVLHRGRVIVADGVCTAQAGDGRFIATQPRS